MRLMGRETWCIKDILSNCVCICLKAFPIKQYCPRHSVMLTMDKFEKKKEKSFDSSSGNAVTEGRSKFEKF